MSIEHLDAIELLEKSSITERTPTADAMNALRAEQLSTLNRTADTSATHFSDWFVNQLSETNQKVIAAEESARRLAVGDAENIHQVMIALQSAKTSFELTVEIRNRLLEGYQEIMRMGI